MTMLKLIGPFELLGLALGMAASCTPTRANQRHCEVQDGDAFCAEKYDDGSRQFCARGIPGCELEQVDGCVAARPVENACYSPCGGRKSVDEDAECEGVAEGSSSSGTVTATDATSEPTGPTTAGSMSASGSEESTSTTSGGGCTESSECGDPAAPICVEMACVPCSSDDECVAKSPGAPACNEDGECVTCTPSNASACEGVTPICNAVNECEGCDFHEQCPDSACRIATGGCFDVAEVYDVGVGQTYVSIEAAVADLGEGGEVVLRIHDGASYDGAVTIAGAGTAYAFLAEDDLMVPQWINSMTAASTLRVEDGAEAYVQSLTLTLNGDGANPGITADGATVYLDRTSVVGNTGGGVLLTNGAAGFLRNCFVRGADGFAAVTSDGSTAEVLYSTVVGVLDTSPALTCDAGVVARNSIIVSRATGGDPDIACPATITYSALELDYPGEGNVQLGALTSGNQDTWFTSYMSGDFHLNNPPGDLLTAARWVTGDPLVDIEGEARPNVDGTADVAGADLP